MVYDYRFHNGCEESVRLRQSTALYLSPSLAQVDADRREVVIQTGRSAWLCGNGQDFTACVFLDHKITNSGYQTDANRRSCYLDQDCPWPAWPD